MTDAVSYQLILLARTIAPEQFDKQAATATVMHLEPIALRRDRVVIQRQFSERVRNHQEDALTILQPIRQLDIERLRLTGRRPIKPQANWLIRVIGARGRILEVTQLESTPLDRPADLRP